jgi:hypothetical protein
VLKAGIVASLADEVKNSFRFAEFGEVVGDDLARALPEPD